MQTAGGDKGKGRKAEGLKNEVAGLEAAVQAASQEYDRVKLRNTQVLTSIPCSPSSCSLWQSWLCLTLLRSVRLSTHW